MSPRLHLSLGPSLVVCLAAIPAHAAPWVDATDETIGGTSEWSNKVELGDINGDGRVDILLANGAGYSSPDGPELSGAYLNKGPGLPFEDVGAAVFVDAAQTRVLKVRDVDGDGYPDIFMGNSFGEPSRLYMGDGGGGFTDASDQLPAVTPSVGDLELGDVDGDGDLDVVLADWGPGDAGGDGGVTQLWLGDGGGGFTDVTATNMPNIKVSWSWELELADVDNDLDLDVLVSCKTCDGSFMFHNDGAGVFTDATDKLPQFANNYEFEAIDLTGDGFLDLITVNDGPMFREHILVGDGMGGFTDGTAELWPNSENVAGDDNMVAFLDYESDGDADFVICGLFGNDDRLLLNDGSGNLTLVPDAFDPADSSGSLGIAVADLNDDKKLDVVFSEGESPQDADRVFLGVDIAEDTAAPKISLVDVDTSNGVLIRARVHDNKTPVMPHDLPQVIVQFVAADDGTTPVEMTWYGEALWRLSVPEAPADTVYFQICATDAAGNNTCSEGVPLDGGTDTTGGDDTTGGTTESCDSECTNDPSATDTVAPTTSGDSLTTETPTSNAHETCVTGCFTETGAETTTPLDDDPGCSCREQDAPLGSLLLVGAGLLVRRRRRA